MSELVGGGGDQGRGEHNKTPVEALGAEGR